MASHDEMSDSTSSFADNQYDMVEDDMSEVSSDDRSTVSIPSIERAASDDGAMTPDEDFGSDDDEDQQKGEQAEEDEDQAIEDSMTGSDSDFRMQSGQTSARTARPGRMTPETWEQVEEENETMDSYLSDELETPRQSTLPLLRRPTRHTQPPSQDTQTTPTSEILSERPLRVLFVADRAVPEAEKSQFCAKITSALAGHEDGSACRAAVLPLTPNGISPSSATMYRDGDVQLEVQHCVGAVSKPDEESGAEQFSLRLTDADGEHTSVYSIGGTLKPDLETQDLAIVYNTQVSERSAWINTALSAMGQLKVSTMVVGEAGARHTIHDFAKRRRYDFTVSEIMGMDSKTLSSRIDGMLEKKQQSNGTKNPQARVTAKTAILSKTKTLRQLLPTSAAQYLAVLVMLLTCLLLGQRMFMPTYNPVAETAMRREALASLLVTNSSDATKTIDTNHLLPQPTATSTDFYGRKLYSTQDEVRFFAAAPNHIIISLPKQMDYMHYRRLSTVHAYKGSHNISYVQTKLIDGVYKISIDPAEAYGAVHVDGIMTNPKGGFAVQHDFGYKILQRQTYKRARTDISKSVTKDLTIARKAAKTFGERLQVELSAGAAATKNVTKELAVQMTRDLQIFAKAASSMAVIVGGASNKTVEWVTKDLILAKQDFKNAGNALKALVPSKKSIRQPLQLSRDRALGLRHKLLGGRKKANSTSITKSLSTRLTDLTKSLQPAKKWHERFLSKRIPTSLSTVPGKGLISKKPGCKSASARDVKARAIVQRERAIKLADREVKRAAEHKKEIDKKAEKHRAKSERVLQKARERAAKLAQA